MKISTLFFFSVLIVISIDAMDKCTQIKNDLSKMVFRDKQLRSNLNMHQLDEQSIQDMETLSKTHVTTLRRILETHEWIKIPVFGADADHNAWLLVQHADHDIEFQKAVLNRLARIYPLGETKACHYAYLYDRIAQNTGLPQKYGTQSSFINNIWVLHPLQDATQVNTYRAEVGLEPLHEYIAETTNALRL
jgi:hypothetical protein